MVENITRIRVRERIPDSVFDHADQVEVIDIETRGLDRPDERGKIYKKRRRCGRWIIFSQGKNWLHCGRSRFGVWQEQVKHIAEEERSVQGELDYHTGEHILVCISAAQSMQSDPCGGEIGVCIPLPVYRIVCGNVGDAGGRCQTKEKLRQHIGLRRRWEQRS